MIASHDEPLATRAGEGSAELSEGVKPPSNEEWLLGELLDVIAVLVSYSRAGTFDEDEGEYEVYKRARAILERYRPAT